MLSNLLTTVRIIQPRLAGVEQFLVTYPALSAAAPSVVPGDGRVHFGLVLNINDPPYCQNGAYLHQAGNGDPQTTWQRADAPPPGGGGPDGYFPMNTTVWCNQGGADRPARCPAYPAAQRRQAALRAARGPEHLLPRASDPARRTPVPSARPGGSRARPPPLHRAQQASSQNANQNTAFSGVSSSPADVLANSGRGAPPIVIPGLG